MTETLRHLRDDRFAQIHLWTLRDTPRSRRFYTKCGFTETGAARAFDFGERQPPRPGRIRASLLALTTAACRRHVKLVLARFPWWTPVAGESTG